MRSFTQTLKSLIVPSAAAMLLTVACAFIALPVGAVVLPGGATALSAGGAEYKAGEIVVRFKQPQQPAALSARMSLHGAQRLRALYASDAEVWQVPAGRERDTAAQLAQDPDVAYAEPNYAFHALLVPTDPLYHFQWCHTYMESPAGWDISTGKIKPVIIAIIDTGIDEGHGEFAGRLVGGADFVERDLQPHDLNGHGTHVAGIAAAKGNNTIGVAGVDWGAKIMALRVLDAQGVGYNVDIAEAIAWGADHHAKVINMSLGGPSYTQAMQDAINYAWNKGAVIVAAMGNSAEDGNPTSYPAAMKNVFAVAATGPDDTRAYYSQYGKHCDISAPGGAMSAPKDPDGILSTLPRYTGFYLRQLYHDTYGIYLNTKYDFLQGTSMAAPQVSGLAALIWSVKPGFTNAQILTTIRQTADDLGVPGWDRKFGWGRINVRKALEKVAPPPPPPSPAP